MKSLLLLALAVCTSCLSAKAEDGRLVWHQPANEVPTAVGGTGIDFFTNSPELVVRYVSAAATGQNAVSLYGADKDGTLFDFPCTLTQGDTVVCRFAPLQYANSRPERGYNFHLTVPEEVQTIEIGTTEDAAFGFDPVLERPIVFLQSCGATDRASSAASLPYLLRRHTGHDVVSLRLNTKGRLTKADKARLAAMDPLLVVYDNPRAARYGKLHDAPVYEAQGDAGEQVEAIRTLLGEDSERRCVFRPVTQQRDPYDWQMRHRNVLKINAEEPPSVVLIGNSITHYWAGLPTGRLIRGTDSWEALWEGTTAHNLGFGWDRIENVLWRINHGELDGYKAEKVLLLLGTNNIAYNTDEEIAEGIVEVVRSVRAHQPEAQICVCSVLPRIDHGERVVPVNAAIQAALQQHQSPARYLDLTPMAFDAEGNFRNDLFSDGLHPNAEGYRVLAARLSELLRAE